MARANIDVKKVETVFDDLDRMQEAIRQRAYDLSRNGGSSCGNALGDWLAAEQELVTKPAIELLQKDGRFEVVVALPGIDAKSVDVQITPEQMLVKATGKHEHATDGTVHVCELGSGEYFRAVLFPEKIDPDSVKAEYKNGLLQVTAAIPKAAAAKKVNIKAA